MIIVVRVLTCSYHIVNRDGDAAETEIIIKEGTMQKRAIGKTTLGRASANWKERYFRLTGAGLTYYTDRQSSSAKGTIRIEQMQDIRASETIPTGFDLIHYHVTSSQVSCPHESEMYSAARAGSITCMDYFTSSEVTYVPLRRLVRS